MRKVLIFLLTVLLALCLTGCKGDESSVSTKDNTIEKSNEVTAIDDNSEQVLSAENVVKESSSLNHNQKAKKEVYLSYSLEKPVTSKISEDSSYVKIVFSSDSSNPAIDKKRVISNINDYVKIKPNIKGGWSVSENGKSLIFKPATEWQPNTKYGITMDKAIFNSYYTVKNLTTGFKTEPFNYIVNKENLKNDFDNKRQKYSLNINFNYLFNQKEFKKNATMILNGKKLDFKVMFSKDGYGVTVESDYFPMVDKKQVISFNLPKIKSSDGSNSLQYEINHTYTIEKFIGKDLFDIDKIQSDLKLDDNGNTRHVLTLVFSEAVNKPELMEKLNLINSDNQKIKLEPIYTGNNADITHSFYVDYNFQESELCYIEINNLESVSGDLISDGYNNSVYFYPLPASMKILQTGSILSLKSDKKITFESKGADALFIQVGKVLPEQIQHIINFSTENGFGAVSFYSSGLNESNFSEYKETTLPLSSNSKVHPSYATVDIAEYVGNEPGLYYIKSSAMDKSSRNISNPNYYNDYDDYYSEDYSSFYNDYSNTPYLELSRFILVTDMYIIAKQNKSNITNVFVASISKGEAVKNAKIEVIGINGLPLLSGTTDSNGHFKYELSKDNKNRPLAIIAKKDNDLTYLPIRNNRIVEYSRFDIGGEYIYNKDALKAVMFTDRGIYRPGETVNIATIIKDIAWKKQLAGVPVQIQILSPKGEIVLDEKYSLDETGFFESELKTQPYFTTGNYSAYVYLLSNGGDRNSRLGNVDFELKEFDTDTIKVVTKIKESSLKKGWIKPEQLTANIKADNMVGTPAVNRRVKAELSFSPYTYRFNEYKGYVFADPYIERVSSIAKPYTPQLSETKTNEKGEVEYNLNSYFQDYIYGTYLLEFSAEVFEAGSGDGVTGYSRTLISPNDYLIGYKTDSYLYYLNTNEKAKVNLIAIDRDLNKISKDKLRYRLVQITYLNQLIKDSNGYYKYSNVKRYNVLNSGDLSISKDGSNVLLPTNSAGNFIYEVVDSNNMVVGKVEYYVSGNESIDTGFMKEAELLLKLDKQEYKSGDTINLNITAPYTGYGLITIEKEKVYSYKWFKADTNSFTTNMKLPDDLEGNGYVNVSFVRDIGSKDIYTAPFSYAVMPFSVDKSKRRIDVSLKAPAHVRPGDTVTIEYKASKNGKIVVFGADEGILQVAGYQLSDLLSKFMQKIALSVTTLQTADLILPDYKIFAETSGIGGGEDAKLMANMIAKKLNPFARTVEKPVVYWSKIIDVKANTQNKVSYTIPSHFNGSMKIMAVAVSKDGVGNTETSFISRAPIVLTPNLPYSAVSGDKFRFSVGISNLIEGADTSEIKITAKPSDHFKIIGDNVKTVNIKQGSEELVIFDMEVLDKLGSGEVMVTAESKGLERPITAKVTSSIRPVTPYITNVEMGSFTSSSKNIKIKQRNMYDKAAKREIIVTDNPLMAVSGIGSYLESYPYGCTEQITSKIYPVVMLSSANNLKNTKEVQDVYNAYIQELTKRQKGKAGFTYWSGGSYVYDLPSIYATQLLTDAKELGYNVPQDLLNKAVDYLKSISNQRPNSIEKCQDIAYATYILARNGIVSARTLSVLEDYLEQADKDWKSSLTASYIGATYILYKNEEKGNQLLKSSVPSYTKFLFWYDFYDSLTNTARYVYLTGRHAPDILKENRKLINRIIDEINEGYYNSFSSAFSLAALNSVSISSNASPDFSANGKLVEVDKTNKNKAYFSSEAESIKVNYKEDNKLGYYYSITSSGFDKNAPKQYSNGIKVTKSYVNKDGKTITSAKQGDEVTVVLNILRNDITYGKNTMVAITDLIAGGTEILTNKGVNVPYAYESHEFREDRAIIYLNIPPKYNKTITYTIKLLSSGDFQVPPAYVESLYNRDINAVSNNFRFVIDEAN